MDPARVGRGILGKLLFLVVLESAAFFGYVFYGTEEVLDPAMDVPFVRVHRSLVGVVPAPRQSTVTGVTDDDVISDSLLYHYEEKQNEAESLFPVGDPHHDLWEFLQADDNYSKEEDDSKTEAPGYPVHPTMAARQPDSDPEQISGSRHAPHHSHIKLGHRFVPHSRDSAAAKPEEYHVEEASEKPEMTREELIEPSLFDLEVREDEIQHFSLTVTTSQINTFTAVRSPHKYVIASRDCNCCYYHVPHSELTLLKSNSHII